jgi:2-polyprenyl-3-methyl-5-hydroxy-6-metoxy-1,4-benzoquinol methylase
MDLIEGELVNPISHWYYRHKFWFIKNSLRGTVPSESQLVDIGAGSALFSKELLRLGNTESVVAVDTGYEEEFDDLGLKISFRKSTTYENFSHFLLTDVLEHIDGDTEFLSGIVKEAKPGSSFIVTVPAHMCLWSNHDVYLRHFRRYKKSELRTLLSFSGLEITSIRYIYSSVFLLAYLQRKLSGKKQLRSQLTPNSLAISYLLRIMLIPDRWISCLPFGVSIFATAKKPN